MYCKPVTFTEAAEQAITTESSRAWDRDVIDSKAFEVAARMLREFARLLEISREEYEREVRVNPW